MGKSWPSLDRWDNLPGSSLAWRIAQEALKQKLVIVAKNSSHARNLAREIKYFSKVSLNICVFPTWEILPYDQFSPHHDIISERLHTLNQLTQSPPNVVILTPESLMMRVPPRHFILSSVTQFFKGQSIITKVLTQQWQDIGYERTNRVEEHCQYAIRGSIIDIFPIGSRKPYRIDLFDDEIDSIRTFDPHTQLTIQSVDKIDILPSHEFILDEIHPEKISSRAKNLAIHQPLPEQMLLAKPFPGIEFFLPLLHDELAFIGEYLSDYEFYIPTNLSKLIEQEWRLISSRFEQYHRIRTCLPPELLWIDHDQICQDMARWPQYGQDVQNRCYIPSLKNSDDAIEQFKAFKTIVFVSSKSHELELLDLLKNIFPNLSVHQNLSDALSDNNPWCLFSGQLSESFIMADVQMALLCETQLLAKRVSTRTKSVTDNDDWHSFHELKIGDYCTHPEHGIGRFITIEKFPKQDDEFLKLEFAKGAYIYVNILHANRIAPYISFGEQATQLDELGTKKWQNRKQKAIKNIEIIAAKLLEVAQKQKMVIREKFAADESFKSFCRAFPFNETPDQKRATEALLQDIASNNPINRLLMGDVGFGKTEIMQRAAYLQACASFKTIVIAPTTILAAQHAERFIERFANFPIEIAHVSRNTTSKEHHKILEKFNNNQIDILIGTHKLFHSHLQAQRVGLIIIDEEHRFGVKQKEHFKALFPKAHFLKVSATPIPRSLGMAFGQIMKLSILSTPPANRHAIFTQVSNYNDNLIMEALTREIHRGGQVYYVLNRIEDLKNRITHLQELMPHIRFDIIHGQLHAKQIQQTMLRFINQEFDVLLTTAIVESGIDVANANTLIVERADLFGLSSLHQLRGRIGRSHHQAYAFFLKDPDGLSSKDAQNRLEALVQHQDLGAGYFLANRDLELRGAGEILGEKQSGHINAIGYSTYVDLLKQELTQNEDGLTIKKPEIKLTVSGALPSHHVVDVNERLKLYTDIANCQNSEQIKHIRDTLIDRFGSLPQYTEHLFNAQNLYVAASKWNISKILESDEGYTLQYYEENDIPTQKIISLLQEKNAKLIPKGPKSFLIKKQTPDLAPIIDFIHEIHSPA